MNVIFRKIKEKGLLWFIKRVRQELRNPSKKPVKTIMDFLLRAKKRMPSLTAKVIEDDLLYCMYDLNIYDLTYIMAIRLVEFEMEAKNNNKKGFIVVIVPSSLDPDLGWKEYDSKIDKYSKLWRFQNLVLPITFLSPSCKGVYVLPRRSDAIAFAKKHDVYPEMYDGINLRKTDASELLHRKWDRPGLFEGLKANKQGLRYVKDWINAKGIQSKIITITIRDSPFDPARNSDIKAWSSFARYLLEAGYSPVIIPDTDNAFCKNLGFEGINFFSECAWNIGLRMALYETAYLNLFAPNGPVTLAFVNPRCSYIAMNSTPKGAIISMDEEAYKKYGHPIGENFKFANQRQRLCFETDTYENIRNEFDRFVKDNPPVNITVETE